MPAASVVVSFALVVNGDVASFDEASFAQNLVAMLGPLPQHAVGSFDRALTAMASSQDRSDAPQVRVARLCCAKPLNLNLTHDKALDRASAAFG